MRHIIITGAGGLVATELIYEVLRRGDAHLYLISTHVENIRNRYLKYGNNVSCFTLDSFAGFSKENSIKYDYCIHTAFSRSSEGSQIVKSIEYHRNLIELLKNLDLGVFVNISSQSVYGKTSEPLWTENTPLDPDYPYALGKYFSEVITEQMLCGSGIKWTNLRLCSVCEKARFVNVFVKNAINGVPIRLTAPEQQCSFIDVRDVADALCRFMERACDIPILPCYNLGANIVTTIRSIAHIVKEAGTKHYGLNDISISKEGSGNHIRTGMDSSLFINTFLWSPKYSIEDMVIELFEMNVNPRCGVYPISFKLVYSL